MNKTLAECLQSVHFQYDFGGGVQKPIHFIHQSSDGSWKLALPFKSSEITKYIAGQTDSNNRVRFYVSKTQMSFPCMESMIVWFVRQDHALNQNENSVSSAIDYETIMSLRNKNPSSDNFNSFLKAVGLDFITVGKVKKIRNSDRISVQILGCNMSQVSVINGDNGSVYLRNSTIIVNYNGQSYNAYSNFLDIVRNLNFQESSASNSLTVQLTDLEPSEDNYQFMINRIVSVIRNNVQSNTRNKVVDQAKLGQVNKFLYCTDSIMLAQIFCNSLNAVIRSHNLHQYLDTTTMDNWAVQINYKFNELKISALPYSRFSSLNEALGIMWSYRLRLYYTQIQVDEFNDSFKNEFMSNYESAKSSMDEWQSNLASTILNRRIAS